MVAIAHPQSLRTPAPRLRLVTAGASPAAAVYRRRRLAALALLVALIVVAVVGASLLSRSSATVRTTTPGSGVVVREPAAYGAAHVPVPEGATYVVRPGDTLWTIAQAIAPDTDVLATVDHLSTLNRTTALAAGQQIRLR
jgi:Tfp pilus assembly protein FimV